jgi:DNA invertase Pin-like site-specific DNA recombinase
MTEIKPAVAFAAKSTTDVMGSIPDQLKHCRELARENGLKIVAEFQDEAASAYHGDRGPGLASALAKCEHQVAEHGSCALIVQHSDRLARGDAKQAKHLVEYALWALKVGVTIHSVQDPEMFSDGDYGLLMSTIGGMRNNQDSKRKGLAVEAGQRRAAEKRGKLSGGRYRPFGYQRIPYLDEHGERQSRLEVDPAEAEIVRWIYTETVERAASQNALANALEKRGVPTVASGRWYPATVRAILMNPLYKGEVRYKGESFPGDHEGIVSPELWADAQTKRKSPARKAGRHPVGSHLCTKGALRCGRCSYAMLPTRYNGREVYECHQRHFRGTSECDMPRIPRWLIDGPLLEDLTDHYFDLAETQKRIEERTVADLTIAREAVVQAQLEMQRTEARLARIQRGWQEEVLDDEDYRQQRAQVLAEQEGAQAALRRAQDHVAQTEEIGVIGDVEQALLRHLATIKESVAQGIGNAPNLDALRRVIRDLFEHVMLLDADHPWLSAVSALRESGPQIEGGFYLIPILRGDPGFGEFKEIDGRERWSKDPAIVDIRKSPMPIELEAFACKSRCKTRVGWLPRRLTR